MVNERNERDEIFDAARVRKLIELLREFDLNEIDLRDSAKRIRIRRGGAMVMAAAPAAAAPAAAASTSAKAPVEEEKNATYIKCPMVGSFYSRPKPDQPPFVKVGDVVSADTIVCIVEAMKMFNEIPAGVSGKIVEVCVKDGEPVDVNKPLFKLAN
jgi:acetyl-CoA carboxylase biotin carboxyl carrier protein